MCDEKGDYPHGTYKMADNFYASHGWMARTGAGASAQLALKTNASIAVGHTQTCFITRYTLGTRYTVCLFRY